jgi:hypothetical protein
MYIGFWLADVMGDSVVAEKARLEPPFAKGITQSSCYSYRFFGYMIAGPISTGLYKYFGPKVVIFLLSALPFSILPLVCTLGEVRYGQVASTKDQCKEIWNTVCSRLVYNIYSSYVYIYIYIYIYMTYINKYIYIYILNEQNRFLNFVTFSYLFTRTLLISELYGNH